MVSQIVPISAASRTVGPDVMIVEDEQTSRRALSVLLAACGYKPQAFSSAEEALRSINEHAFPTVALVDLDLPGMNGLELIGRLEKLNPSVFPILITATDQETLSAGLRGRAVAYLRKPLDFDTLLSLLRQPVARRH